MNARSAIEALRAGVPNRAAIRVLGTNETAIEEAFEGRLEQCRLGLDEGKQARGLVVAGGFGAGKSHLLGTLRELAIEQNFIVSLVPISKETPLFDAGKLYVAAMRNAIVPDRNDDVMTAVLADLVRRRDGYETLERWTNDPASGLPPLFAALLHLIPRQTATPENVRAIERFLGGGKLGNTTVKQWLRAAGAGRRFELKPVKEADMAVHRLRFAPRLFAAAGYAGWCILLDEVELIGRYGAMQRGRSYAELSRWIGLDSHDPLPGVVSVCAITDDFVDSVIDRRRDEELVPPKLEARGQDRTARLAREGMRALGKQRTLFLRQPDEAVLRRTLDKVGRLYEDAYGWDPRDTGIGERLAQKTMRQYIKSWITRWDMQRLYDERQEIATESMRPDYTEDPDLEQVPAEPLQDD